MSYSSMTQKGQVTIPTEFRKALGIRQGDRVKFAFSNKEHQVIIEKYTQPVEELFGLYKVDFAVSDADIKEGIKKGATRAHRARY